MSGRSAAKNRLSEFLHNNCRPRSYEIVFALFAVLTIVLVRSFSRLPFSSMLAGIFALNLLKLFFAVYALAAVVIFCRITNFCTAHGPRALTLQQFLKLTLPYATLDFLFLTLRRGFAVLGTIYFFLHLKHIILFINPSNHDLFFWNLDRTIHFGVQPNAWLMTHFGGNPEFSLLIDWLYIKYFDYKILVSVLFLMELKGRVLSERFFLATVLLWAVGGTAYLAMPTDGPCFSILGHHSVPETQQRHIFQYPVTTDIPPGYAETYSQSKIFSAKIFQEDLWKARWELLFANRIPNAFYGIGAMPSLHVGATILLMLFMFKTSALLGLCGALYAAIIFMGSIFLQWHYAIDGYAGAALALAAYLASKKLITDEPGGGCK